MVKNQEIFLGIDGGATKSTLVLIDAEEKKIFKAVGRSLNLRNIGKRNFLNNLNSLLKKIKPSFKKNIKGAYFGLAGVDSKEDKKNVTEAIKKISKKILPCPFVVVNDIEIILPSVGLQDGVVAICGTGSNFFAKKDKKEAFAGGLDYILSDEAGAFDIGVRILRAAVKSFDGRGEESILEEMVLRKTGVKNIRNLTNFIYKGNKKTKVASLAPLLAGAIEKKDKAAGVILKSVLEEIFSGVSAVAKRVGLRDNFYIAIVGSVFHNKFLVDEVIEGARKKFKNVKITMVPEPEVGAAKLAKKKFG
ncbi:MAG: BadF/BadG/BcrA/BcrD ATPase family protein [Candidatus Pacebacteria bacterium]|nr:BadF/BadG/BcrA/BcrD ATPase family protein [Candidatus Paceibacterota bacterium]